MSFNQTKVELKYRKTVEYSSYAATFNQTKVELKYSILLQYYLLG